MTDLGSSIRAIRERNGMKQAALARALQIAPQTLSNYELGPNKVPANKVPQIADALGVTICGLYGVEEGHQVPPALTLAEQLAQALGVEPGRIEVNVYPKAEPFEPARADYDTRAALRAWEAMPPEVQREWLEFADRLRRERGET